jgi:Holliday junction resolvasome RuvABC endonuclease subunit
MALAGSIFALDLAARTGFAVGPCGELARSGAVALKKPGDAQCIALGNLIAWLDEQWRKERPGLVVKEAALPLQAFRARSNSASSVAMTHKLHGIVEGMAVRFGVSVEEAHPATVRKHFIGRGRMGTREASKAAVIQRCRVLGFIPHDCADADRADAIALWDWAGAKFGSRQGRRLYLFGEGASQSATEVPFS